ncbi:unnamed protein product [Closterium sp. NIES-54]
MAARFVAILLLATLAFASANDGQNTLTSQLRSAGCSGFAKLLEQADMVTELEGKLDSGEATLFVPSDDSLMYKVSPALLAYLKAPVNKDILRKVLLFHVVPERISAFKWDGDHATLEGSPAVLRMDALAFYVSNVAVKEYNAIISKDAVVHSIRGLLIPPSLEEALGSIDFGAVDVHEDDGRRILAAPGSENSPGSDAAPAPPAPTVSPSPPATTAPPPSTTSPTPPMPSARIVAGFRWFVSVAADGSFQHSPARYKIELGGIYDYVIVSDAAYGLRDYILTPYRALPGRGLPDEQRVWNLQQSRARMIVEQVNGRLKTRWRMLDGRLECDIFRAPQYVSAYIVLHNIDLLLGPRPRLLPPRERNTWWQHGPAAEMPHFSPRDEGFTPTRRRARMAACLYASWRLGHPEQTQPTLGYDP